MAPTRSRLGAWRLALLLGAVSVGSGDLASAPNESELLNFVDFEISETKQLVSLLQRKAQRLRDMHARCAAIAPSRCSATSPPAAPLLGAEHLLPRLVFDVGDAGIDALALVPARGRSYRRGRNRRAFSGVMQLALAADSIGQLHAFNPMDGTKLGHIGMGCNGTCSSVVAMAAEIPELPTIATVHADGSVRVFNATLLRDGVVVVGPRSRTRAREKQHRHKTPKGEGTGEERLAAASTLAAAENASASAGARGQSGFELNLRLERALVPPTLGDDLGRPLSALLHRKRGRPSRRRPNRGYVLVGYERGVRAYLLDGEQARQQPPKPAASVRSTAGAPPSATASAGAGASSRPGVGDGVLYSFATPAPVRALVKLGTYFAFSSGADVGFFSLSGVLAPARCHGVLGHDGVDSVVSLATDPSAPQVLFAGLSSGGVLVLSVKRGRGWGARGRGPGSCRLLHYIRNPTEGMSGGARVACVPGLLFASSAGGAFALYNTTVVQRRGISLLARSTGTHAGDPVLESHSNPALLLATGGPGAILAAAPGGRGGRGGAFGGGGGAGGGSTAQGGTQLLALVGVPKSRSMFLVEAVVPLQQASNFDAKWMRSPLVVIGLVVVFGTQFFGKGKGPGMGGGAGLMGGGMAEMGQMGALGAMGGLGGQRGGGLGGFGAGRPRRGFGGGSRRFGGGRRF